MNAWIMLEFDKLWKKLRFISDYNDRSVITKLAKIITKIGIILFNCKSSFSRIALAMARGGSKYFLFPRRFLLGGVNN